MQDKQCIVNDYETARGIFDLPNLVAWDGTSNRAYDILIFPLGFEGRAINVIQKLTALKSPSLNNDAIGLIGKYVTNVSDNEKHRSMIEVELKKLCGAIEYFDADSPLDTFITITSNIEKLLKTKSRLAIAIDISAASGTLILSAFKALLGKSEHISITVFYTEAKNYYPDHCDYESNADEVIQRCCKIGDPDTDHEYGVELVDINELYAGHPMENRNELVIAIPSFRTERLRQSLQYISEQILALPGDHIYWVFGVPPSNCNKWRNELQRRIVGRFMCSSLGLEINEGSSSVALIDQKQSCDVSTLDYRATTSLIVDLADKNIGKSISVLHMGSKMQALGLSLALHVRSEVTIFYARPTSFKASRYSMGIGDAHKIVFENPHQALAQLGKIGTLEFTPAIETDRSGKPAA